MTSLPRDHRLPDRIRAKLRERLRVGNWAAGDKLPAERDLAKEFAVSRLTVRRAIEGLIEEGLLYRQPPNGTFVTYAPVTRPPERPAGPESSLGLVVMPGLHESIFAAMVAGVSEGAALANQHLLLRCCKLSPQLERQSLSEMLGMGVRGLLLIPSSSSAANTGFLRELESRLPLVVLDNRIAGLESDFVTSDDARGTRLAIQHLIDLGHRRIACLHPPLSFSTVQERVGVYAQVLREQGLDDAPELRLEAHWDRASAYAAVKKAVLHGRLDGVSAMFCCSDRMAVGACNACRELGWRLPEDLALVGYGDLDIAEAADLPLTTVRQHPERVGEQAVALLMEKVDGQRPPTSHQTRLIEPQLVLRESCGIGLDRRHVEQRLHAAEESRTSAGTGRRASPRPHTHATEKRP